MSHRKFIVVVQSTLLLLLLADTSYSQADSTVPLRRNFKLFGGICVPTGDLGATTTQKAGYANTGFDVGADFSVEAVKNFQIGMMGNFASLSVDEATLQSQFQSIIPGSTITAGSWKLIWIMANVGFIADLSTTAAIYGRGNAGLHMGFAPDLSVSSGAASATATYSSATTIGYGFAAGILINNKFDLGFQFLTAEPEYSFTVTGTGGSSTSKAKQPESLLEFNVGYVFN